MTRLPHSVGWCSSENDAPAGAPPISATVPRMPTDAAACCSTATTPAQSMLKSAGPPQISCTAATGSGRPTRRSSRSRRARGQRQPGRRAGRPRWWVAAVEPGGHHRREADRPGPVDHDRRSDKQAAARSAPAPARWRSRTPAARGSTSASATRYQRARRADRVRRERDWPKKWLCSGDPSSRRSAVEPSAGALGATSGPSDRQYRGCPSRQFRHDPHQGQPITTLSRPDTLVTPSPTAATTPGALVPEHARRRERHVPVAASASVWQTPAATILTSASPGPGSSISTSATESGREQLLEYRRGSAHGGPSSLPRPPGSPPRPPPRPCQRRRARRRT